MSCIIANVSYPVCRVDCCVFVVAEYYAIIRNGTRWRFRPSPSATGGVWWRTDIVCSIGAHGHTNIADVAGGWEMGISGPQSWCPSPLPRIQWQIFLGKIGRGWSSVEPQNDIVRSMKAMIKQRLHKARYCIAVILTLEIGCIEINRVIYTRRDIARIHDDTLSEMAPR